MKKNTMTKIIASLAFFWILLSIIGTGLLIIFWENNQQVQQQELTPEQLDEIQKIIDSQSGSTSNPDTLKIPIVEEIITDVEEIITETTK